MLRRVNEINKYNYNYLMPEFPEGPRDVVETTSDVHYVNRYSAMDFFWLKRIDSISLSAAGGLEWKTAEIQFDIRSNLQLTSSNTSVGNNPVVLEPEERVALYNYINLFYAGKRDNEGEFFFSVSMPHTDDYERFAFDINGFWAFRQHSINFCAIIGSELYNSDGFLTPIAHGSTNFAGIQLPITLYGAFQSLDVKSFQVSATINTSTHT